VICDGPFDRLVHAPWGQRWTVADTTMPARGGADPVERVTAATVPTVPGADPENDPDVTHEGRRQALRIPLVRGLVEGGALLCPEDDDVTTAVERAVRLLEGGRYGQTFLSGRIQWW